MIRDKAIVVVSSVDTIVLIVNFVEELQSPGHACELGVRLKQLFPALFEV